MDSDTDPDSVFIWCGSGFLFDADADPDPDSSLQIKAQITRIRIHNTAAFTKYLDPYPIRLSEAKNVALRKNINKIVTDFVLF